MTIYIATLRLWKGQDIQARYILLLHILCVVQALYLFRMLRRNARYMASELANFGRTYDDHLLIVMNKQ